MVLSRIHLFPIKSLDGISVVEARINSAGILEHDRVYAIVDANGSYVNGKRTGRVHLIRTTFAEDYQEASFWIQGETGKQNFVLNEPVRINRWLSDFFGFNVQLICEPVSGFADDRAASGPTIVSEGSLQEVVRWFPEFTFESARRRFRSNLELGGVEPFWEDHLFGTPKELKPFLVGEVSFLGHNPCQRCVVPSRDPESGIQSVPNFQKIFTALRKECLPSWANNDQFNHFYRFAVNTSIPSSEAGKTLRVGDTVRLRPGVYSPTAAVDPSIRFEYDVLNPLDS
jgi:MOSC domain-containing protein